MGFGFRKLLKDFFFTPDAFVVSLALADFAISILPHDLNSYLENITYLKIKHLLTVELLDSFPYLTGDHVVVL